MMRAILKQRLRRQLTMLYQNSMVKKYSVGKFSPAQTENKSDNVI